MHVFVRASPSEDAKIDNCTKYELAFEPNPTKMLIAKV